MLVFWTLSLAVGLVTSGRRKRLEQRRLILVSLETTRQLRPGVGNPLRVGTERGCNVWEGVKQVRAIGDASKAPLLAKLHCRAQLLQQQVKLRFSNRRQPGRQRDRAESNRGSERQDSPRPYRACRNTGTVPYCLGYGWKRIIKALGSYSVNGREGTRINKPPVSRWSLHVEVWVWSAGEGGAWWPSGERAGAFLSLGGG